MKKTRRRPTPATSRSAGVRGKTAARPRGSKAPRRAAPSTRPNTRTELLALAKRVGLRGRHEMDKAGLIRALTALGALTAAPSARKAPPAAPEMGAAPTGAAAPEPEAPAHPPEPGLPERYGLTELVALPVDPMLVFLYWEVTPEAIEGVRGRLGRGWSDARMVLRCYHLGESPSNGVDPAQPDHVTHQWDVDVAGAIASWYVPLWSPEQYLAFELGWRALDGRFVAAVRSNRVRTPRQAPCASGWERWMTVVDGRIVTSEELDIEAAGGERGPLGPSSYAWAVRRS